MDLIVTPSEDGTGWTLSDLLGRAMGRVARTPAEQFTVHPAGPALATMAGLQKTPFSSLDAALAEIEKHTRGTCRRSPDPIATGRSDSRSPQED